MKRQEVFDRLAVELPALRERFGIADLALFGSTARDEAHEGSDLDFLVKFEGSPMFDNYFGLRIALEDLFGLKIDLATPDSLRPELKSRIEKEAIHVP